MTSNGFVARASVVIRGAIVAAMAMPSAAPARAQEASQAPAGGAAAITQVVRPISTVEFGFGDVGNGSFKAGEYNGLQKKGGFAIGNLALRDPARYDSASAFRWRLTGSDLGLSTRELHADVRRQGRVRALFDFSQLLRNRSDTYQTPYLGDGTNVLTLPGTWLVPLIAGSSGADSFTTLVSARGLVSGIATAPYIDVRTTSPNMGALLTPTLAQIWLVNRAAAADLGAFRNVNLSTKRTDVGGAIEVAISDGVRLAADVTHEHKDGLKPMGTVSRNNGSDISAIIPDVIDQDHNQVDATLAFKRGKAFAQVGYYGSFFTNNISSMSWQNWATGPTATTPGVVNVMSSPPANAFDQVNGSGGFAISSKARFVVDASYGRATQNQAFLRDATTPVVPVGSLNGVVVSTLLGAKLTSRPTKKLALTAAYKFDNHDNQTPVNIYQYSDAGEAIAASANFPAGAANPLGAVLAQNANANRAYSVKRNQASLEADYPLGTRQWINGAYVFERVNRACPGSWISCADVATSDEQTARAAWRVSISQDFSVRIGYDHSARRGDYNENAFLALVPYANVSPAAAVGGATAVSFMNANGWNGWGPALGFAPTTGNMNLFFPSNNALANAMYANGNRISELPGLLRYYAANRDRDRVRSTLAWQINESYSIEGGGNFNNDRYPDTVFGLQSAKSWTADLDATYAPSDTFNATVFYTYENLRSGSAGQTYTANSNAATITNGQPGVVGLLGNSCDGFTTLQQRNNNNKIDPCLPWTSNTLDRVHTIGAGARKRQGRIDLQGDLTFARARSDNDVAGGNWANNLLNGPGAPPTTYAAVFIGATPFPTVRTDSLQARASGTWTVAARQFIRVGYSYLRMTNSDWIYEGMNLGIGTLSGVLPTSEQPFNYAVHTVGISYLVNF